MEAFFDNLSTLKPTNEDTLGWFKEKLVDIEYQYRTTSMRQRTLLTEAHLRALKELKSNEKVVALRPDKGYGVIVMDKVCYKEKLLSILNDERKFRVDKIKDYPQELEKISIELKILMQAGLIRESTVKQLRPRAGQTPRFAKTTQRHSTATHYVIVQLTTTQISQVVGRNSKTGARLHFPLRCE
ncbi:unnamed protein product [Echinostoma caproni]|uniref:DNA-directed RNA polymerase III subunit RPC3 n=1 Tax=Echinostoma caproni TaxID=27848 RepID=A0A183ATF7_9TREM|nr:unnamed protein product [Echinostoma caproni]